MVSRGVLRVGCVATFLAASIASAADLDFQVGGLDSSLAVASPGDTLNSYYHGNGANLGFRFRFTPRDIKIYEQRIWGIDLTSDFSMLYARNRRIELGERFRQTAYGFGADIWYRIYFLGVQYEWNSTVVLAPITRLDLFYTTFGPRLGLNFYLKKKFALRVGASLVSGNIPTLTQLNKPATELRVFMLFSFNLVRTDPWWISQWLM